MTTPTMIAPWRLFVVEVRELHRLSPSFLRVTVTGDDLDAFADNGFDQRFKLVLPVGGRDPEAELPGDGLADLPTGPDWYQQWRALPDERRNPIRTYTVRAVRQPVREVDVDIVCHHGTGPAARWAEAARPGDRLGLIGPDAGYQGDHGGVEFRPPAAMATVLLAGDETAVPAICAILERLPEQARGEALLEVPVPADTLPVDPPPHVRVRWLPRHGAPQGSQLIPAVTAAADRLLSRHPAPPGHPFDDIDVDEQILWEVPEAAGTPAGAGELYAWLAGEAAVIRTLRRQLVADRGLDRRSVAFMGYWRLGRAEAA
jgi:NADPH-dependent ferric siderophore reductase